MSTIVNIRVLKVKLLEVNRLTAGCAVWSDETSFHSAFICHCPVHEFKILFTPKWHQTGQNCPVSKSINCTLPSNKTSGDQIKESCVGKPCRHDTDETSVFTVSVEMGYRLDVGRPPSTHRRTEKFVQIRLGSALVFTHIEKKDWFTVCSLKSDEF